MFYLFGFIITVIAYSILSGFIIHKISLDEGKQPIDIISEIAEATPPIIIIYPVVLLLVSLIWPLFLPLLIGGGITIYTIHRLRNPKKKNKKQQEVEW